MNGIELLVQELVRSASVGQELAFYHGFLVGRRYVWIVAIGPETNEKELSRTAAMLRLQPKEDR